MAGWAGFSEEELMKMRHHKDTSDSSRRIPSTNKSRQQLQREKALKQQIQKADGENGRGLIPLEQQLSKPTKSTPRSTQPPPGASTKGPDVYAADKNLEVLQDHVEAKYDKKEDSNVEQNPTSKTKETEPRDKSRLDQLQLEQRLMEEKNKRKKALLAKAIAERSKKTQAETVKLKRIQRELQALDDMVSTEIGILRNRIDQACLDFSYAKKRFDKAEAEYIASKLDFHRKTEIKEQLAEHLCTIIQQNELRKAKKLEELMQQLEVETDEEKLELEIEVEQMLLQQENEARRQNLQGNAAAALPGNVAAALQGNASAALQGNAAATPQGNAAATPPGNAGATPPGNAGATPPGNAGAIPPGNAGATPPWNAGATPPGNAGATPPGNAGATPPGNAGATLQGSAAAALQGNASSAQQGNASSALQGNAAATLHGNAALQGNASSAQQGNAAATLQGTAVAPPPGTVVAPPPGNAAAPPPGNAAAPPPGNAAATTQGKADSTIPVLSSRPCALPTALEKENNNIAAFSQATGKPLSNSLDNVNNNQNVK